MHCAVPLLCLALAACAGPQLTVQRSDSFFRDDLFAPPAERVDAADVFALNDEMRQFLRNEIAGQLRTKGAQHGLIEALYKKGQLRLAYEASFTRNAAEAFSSRSGNCLSLVIMTAAFAKELGLQLRYQSAYAEEAVSRHDSLLMRSGHVNVSLGKTYGDARTTLFLNPLVVDFLPADELRGLRLREIDEETVVAMYFNNRAVEAVAQGRLDDAYAWARGAVRQSPEFPAALNTLGVVYMRHGDLPQATTVFEHILVQDPVNKPALANLAQVLARLGRVDESSAVSRRLARLEPDPPFRWFNLGLDAMRRGEFRAARDFFAKEVARADYQAEFHFWLALANFRMGDSEQAGKELALALERSATQTERDRYSEKLAWLQAQRR